MESNKTEKSEPSFIEMVLYYTAGFFLFSAFVYSISNTPDKWFSRITIAIISFGFAGVIREIRKARK